MKAENLLRNAKWIWHDLHEYDLVNSWMQARRTFELEKVPGKAVLNVTADSHYRLFVNGRHVQRGPARGFQASWPYDTVDIAPFLRKGRNVMAALVHCLGVGTFGYVPGGNAGFLAWGKAGREDLSTGKDWKVRAAPGYARTMTRVSLELNFQEIFDARLDDGSWLSEEYDDGGWKVPLCRSAGCMPWPALEERGIPPLREETVLPQRIVSEARGKCNEAYGDPANIVKLYLDEEKRWAPTDARLAVADDWARLKVPPAGKGRFRAYCLDHGAETVGSLVLDIAGGEGNEIIDTLVCEAVDGRTPVFIPVTEGSRPAFGNRLYPGRGGTRHGQFDFWGQRYLVLVVRNSTEALDIRLRLERVGYPLEVRAAFSSSDGRLDGIYEMCVRTQQCCMLDAYVDCPWREQAQWWGDARVQGRNTFFLSADARLFRRGIVQLGTQEAPNGLTYGVAPTTSHRCILPDFSLIWVLSHWDYYWQTGDLSLFKAHRKRVHRLLEYFSSVTAGNGLIPYDDRYWLFLDWHPLFKEGYPTVYNLLYLWALRTAAGMFRRVRDGKAARAYGRRAKELEAAIKLRLWNGRTGRFHGGLDWKGRPAGACGGAHSLALAILLDLFPERQEEWVERSLVPMVKGDCDAPDVPSPYFLYYVFEALKKKGRNAEVVDCIRRWWGSMLDRGLSTTEEIWNARAGRESLCHAWSAHPIIHLSNIVLGVWQEAPGWKRVRFSPDLSTAISVEGKVAVPQGVIEVSWSRRAGSVEARISLPAGVTGTACLPGVKKKDFRGKTGWALD